MARPTRPGMFHNTLDALDSARNDLSTARDWLNADWVPDNSSLPDPAGAVRREILTEVAEMKSRIDAMKRRLYEAIDATERAER